MLEKFNVTIVKAIDRYDIAHEFALKHLDVLKEFNVKGVSSIKPEWKYKPNVYIIAVYDSLTNNMIGGMRLELSTKTYLLPFETALKKEVNSVQSFVSKYRIKGGACEFSGLWVDKAYGKLNIPSYMTMIGVALANKLNIKHAFAFANNYSRPLTEKLGFIATELDGQKVFLYPDERYPTQLMKKECLEVKPSSMFSKLVDNTKVLVSL